MKNTLKTVSIMAFVGIVSSTAFGMGGYKKVNHHWRKKASSSAHAVHLKGVVTDNKAAAYLENRLALELIKFARINGVRVEDTMLRNGETYLHIAAKFGDEDIVRSFLIAGARVNAVDHNGQTPLHIAAKKGSVEIVKVLLMAGADLNIFDLGGHTSLQLAQINNQQLVVDAILSWERIKNFRI